MGQHYFSVWHLEATGLNQFRHWHLGLLGAFLQCTISHPDLFIFPETQEGDHFSPLGRSGGCSLGHGIYS